MNAAVHGFPVTKCGRCGSLYFPRRLICHRCGNDTWAEDYLREAVTEESTTVQHVAGRTDGTPRHLATVRALQGIRLIVGLEAPLPEGTRVLLFNKDGAPVAKPA